MTVKGFYRVLLTADVILITIASLIPKHIKEAIIIAVTHLTPSAHIHTSVDTSRVGHFLFYTSLAFIICLNFNAPQKRVIALLSGIAYGALMELAQHLVPGRETSMLDQIANTMGIITGAAIFVLFPGFGKRLELFFRRLPGITPD